MTKTAEQTLNRHSVGCADVLCDGPNKSPAPNREPGAEQKQFHETNNKNKTLDVRSLDIDANGRRFHFRRWTGNRRSRNLAAILRRLVVLREGEKTSDGTRASSHSL